MQTYVEVGLTAGFENRWAVAGLDSALREGPLNMMVGNIECLVL